MYILSTAAAEEPMAIQVASPTSIIFIVLVHFVEGSCSSTESNWLATEEEASAVAVSLVQIEYNGLNEFVVGWLYLLKGTASTCIDRILYSVYKPDRDVQSAEAVTCVVLSNTVLNRPAAELVKSPAKLTWVVIVSSCPNPRGSRAGPRYTKAFEGGFRRALLPLRPLEPLFDFFFIADITPRVTNYQIWGRFKVNYHRGSSSLRNRTN